MGTILCFSLLILKGGNGRSKRVSDSFQGHEASLPREQGVRVGTARWGALQGEKVWGSRRIQEFEALWEVKWGDKDNWMESRSFLSSLAVNDTIHLSLNWTFRVAFHLLSSPSHRTLSARSSFLLLLGLLRSRPLCHCCWSLLIHFSASTESNLPHSHQHSLWSSHTPI